MRIRPTCLLGALLWLVFCQSALAAPAADLWPRWQAHDSASNATIDHSVFNRFLDDYVVTHETGPNGVRYADVTTADAKALHGYVDSLEAIRIDDYAREVQRAYWINLYNAVTLALVIDHWPVESIRDIDAGVFDSGPWDEKRVTVEGITLSLNDIEHRILRPIWHDGMTHYGVNCASISCPSLRASAYTGADVADALAANARAYVASPQGARTLGGRLVVSKIYQWYGADFGGPAGVLKHLARLAPADKAKAIATHDTIDGYAYDWSVNSPANVEKTRANDN